MAEMTPTTDDAARELARAVHDTTYRWPAGFPGFAADLVLAHDTVTAAGTVRVRPPRAIEIRIDADAADRTWLRREIAAMVGHRWPAPVAADGQPAPRLAPDDRHVLGRQIRFATDGNVVYRVQDGRVSQIVRTTDTTRLAITMQDHLITGDGRVLPTEYGVASWDTARGRLTGADTYSDRYIVVANAYLPAARRVVSADDAGVTTRQFTLSRHHLLPGDDAGAVSSAP